MRLQLLLDALCHEGAAEAAGESARGGRGGGAHAEGVVGTSYMPPCGVGSHFFEQAHRVHQFNASCSCGLGLSITKPDYCVKQLDASGNAAVQYLRVAPHPVGEVGEGYGRAREHALRLLAQLPLGPLERLAERGMAGAAASSGSESVRE